MPRAHWPLVRDRPMIEVMLTMAQGGQALPRVLLADTGAGNRRADFELLLDEDDCLLCGGKPCDMVSIRGAYSGSFPLYLLRVKIPQLNFDDEVFAVGVPSNPRGFDGIACFRFVSRFTYGNFGNASAFGLET